jgi:AcrR family transcriptional regulator
MAKTAKGRATRKTFQDAARTVFARNGYLNTRIEDIAEEAGKAPGTFYLYFDNKEALLESLAADFNDELQDRVAAVYRSGIPAKAALRGAIGEFWHHHRRNLGAMIGMLQGSMVDPHIAAMWQKIRADGIRSIALGIRQAQADGFAPGLDPDIAASALSSMIEYFSYLWQAVGGETPGVELTDEHAVHTLWLLWSHAVYWTEPFPDVSAESADEMLARLRNEGRLAPREGSP